MRRGRSPPLFTVSRNSKGGLPGRLINFSCCSSPVSCFSAPSITRNALPNHFFIFNSSI
jgi:hypothetical protein